MLCAHPSQEGTVQRMSVQRMSVKHASSVDRPGSWTVRVRGPSGFRGRAASKRWLGAISRPL